MPFVLLVVGAFLIGLALDRGPGRRTYLLLALAAIAATVYYMR